MKNQIGWICPKCGKGLAPWVSECSCAGESFIPYYGPLMPRYNRPATGDPLPIPSYTTCGAQ